MDFQHSELLTPDDEIELARRIEVGVLATEALRRADHPNAATDEELAWLIDDGKDAWRQFFVANLRLVNSLAQTWASRLGLDARELFQEGCLGLAEALRRFDYTWGTRFSTFAWPWVNAMMAAAASLRCGELDGAASSWRGTWRVRRVQREMEGQSGRPVAASELADELGRSTSWVQHQLTRRRPLALDAGRVGEMARTMVADGTELTWWPRLAPGYRRLLAARFGLGGEEPVTLAEISRSMGISVSSARRMEQRALSQARVLASEELRAA